MDNEKAASAFLKGSNMSLNTLLNEIESEGYTTIQQVIGSIHSSLEINKGLKGGGNE